MLKQKMLFLCCALVEYFGSTYLPDVFEKPTESSGEVLKLPQASNVDYFGSTYLPNVSENSTESGGDVVKLLHASKVIKIDDGKVDLVQRTGVEPTANSTIDSCCQLQDSGRQSGDVSANQDQYGCVAVMPYDGGRAEPMTGVEPMVAPFDPGGMLVPMIVMMFQLYLLFRKMVYLIIILQRTSCSLRNKLKVKDGQMRFVCKNGKVYMCMNHELS